MIILYRPSTNKIIWKGTGPFFDQHDVNILDDHRISVFNNNVKIFESGREVDGSNEVIIYNFETNQWEKQGTGINIDGASGRREQNH